MRKQQASRPELCVLVVIGCASLSPASYSIQTPRSSAISASKCDANAKAQDSISTFVADCLECFYSLYPPPPAMTPVHSAVSFEAELQACLFCSILEVG